MTDVENHKICKLFLTSLSLAEVERLNLAGDVSYASVVSINSFVSEFPFEHKVMECYF